MSLSRPLDRITINDLRTRTIVGFNDWERTKKQDISISITLHADLQEACQNDAVEDTVDYKKIKKRVLALVENSRFQLIERMAEAVAEACLEEPRVARVDVTVDKLFALRFARSVAVEITRTKEGE
jgi:FolB domain-containing protein